MCGNANESPDIGVRSDMSSLFMLTIRCIRGIRLPGDTVTGLVKCHTLRGIRCPRDGP